MDPIQVNPLPAQARLLDAFSRLGFQFKGADLERGTLHGLLERLGALDLSARVPKDAWYNISTSQLISICLFIGEDGTDAYDEIERAVIAAANVVGIVERGR